MRRHDTSPRPGRSFDALGRTLRALEGRGYKAYQEIRGPWGEEGLTLDVEHVQGDPFATPSRVRVRVDPARHAIPSALLHEGPRRVAVCDYVLRVFARLARKLPRVAGTGHSGRVFVDAGGAEILPRSGCRIAAGGVLELRFRVGLPARGRRVMGHEAAELLARRLPALAAELTWKRLDPAAMTQWAELCEDHAHLQERLPELGLVAFVRDGSILPRATGISSEPLRGAVPFRSPESLRVTLPTLHHGEVTGMGLPAGVTLITGGGFHGKTTLLEAIQFGIYPHVPGDGREWVVTRRDALKVRSEDGRAVAGVDLRPFIHDLPGRASTERFTTQDASGSTSLAAAILEALEMGAGVLLLDEDTCATNLLIRDARMQALVRKETITPLVDRVRELRERLGVSTILVVGGSGDYLDVADRVLLLEDFLPRDASGEARQVAEAHHTGRSLGDPAHPLRITARWPRPESFDPRRGRREKIRARGLRELVFGEQVIDLTALEQLVDDSQARAIGVLLRRMPEAVRREATLADAVRAVWREAAERGLAALDPSPELALPRELELAGAVNRLRSLEVEPAPARPAEAKGNGTRR